MNLSVTVLHNVSDDTFFRFHPETSRLFHAHTFQVVADNVDSAANLMYTLTNVDDANHLNSMGGHLGLYGPQVTDYRRRRNRSLSVSDVLVFHELEGDDQRIAGVRVVAGLGFDALEFEPGFTDGSNDTAVSQAYLASESRYRRQRA